MKFSAKNPALRVAAKRWQQFMKDDKIIFKSRGRRYFRMLIISILAVLCFYFGFTNDNRILIILGVIFTIGILIQYFGHVESQIIIDDTTLKVTRKISGLMLSE